MASLEDVVHMTLAVLIHNILEKYSGKGPADLKQGPPKLRRRRKSGAK